MWKNNCERVKKRQFLSFLISLLLLLLSHTHPHTSTLTLSLTLQLFLVSTHTQSWSQNKKGKDTFNTFLTPFLRFQHCYFLFHQFTIFFPEKIELQLNHNHSLHIFHIHNAPTLPHPFPRDRRKKATNLYSGIILLS